MLTATLRSTGKANPLKELNKRLHKKLLRKMKEAGVLTELEYSRALEELKI